MLLDVDTSVQALSSRTAMAVVAKKVIFMEVLLRVAGSIFHVEAGYGEVNAPGLHSLVFALTRRLCA